MTTTVKQGIQKCKLEKVWGYFLNTLQQMLHNKMVELTTNLQLYLEESAWCWMAEILTCIVENLLGLGNQYNNCIGNNIVKLSDWKSAFQQFVEMDEKKSILSSLPKSGDIFIITNQKTMKAKLDNWAKFYIWLGCANNHAVDTYHIFDPKTQKLILACEVVFIKTIFHWQRDQAEQLWSTKYWRWRRSWNWAY